MTSLAHHTLHLTQRAIGALETLQQQFWGSLLRGLLLGLLLWGRGAGGSTRR